ncbi:alpha/beta hydrolase family protein [Kineococcus glutinatus]|uniref:alpha/beta hydrolase n=1 Tax=Kineococcus glutinatus TaxID=1070872 RepID=UPI0031F0F26E
MAHLRVDFFSEALGLSTSMTVLLPQSTTAGQIGMAGGARQGGHPVLYLLHGLSDDDTTWARRTSIERYAAPLGLAVVMPQVHRSFYADEARGGRYWTFLSEELPALVAGFFNVSDRREDTFVAGLSMGGYGALKWALRQPERFAAAASLSGALDAAARARAPHLLADMRRILGDDLVLPREDDLLHLVRDAGARGADLPALHVACGTEDELLGGNRHFVATAHDAGVTVTSEFGPGAHDWAYWDARIAEVLAWLPLRAAGGQG